MNSSNAPASTSATLSKRKRTTVVTPEKKIQKKINRNRCDRIPNTKDVEEQSKSMVVETNSSSSDEICDYSNGDAEKDITKLEENQYGESKVSSSSFDNLERDVIDLTETGDEKDSEKSNTVAAKQQKANIVSPWESALSQMMKLTNDEITLLKDVQADINSSEVKQEDEMESSSAERCGAETIHKKRDTMKKELSSESLPDLVSSHPKCKSDADEEDDSNNEHGSSGIYDSDTSNEALPDLVPSKPETDADEINDGTDLPENYAMKPVLRRSPRRNRNNEGNVEDVHVKDISDQSIQGNEEMSNEGDEEDQDADYQRDVEIQQNLINLFKDLPRKRCKNADKKWKALFTTKEKRKLVRIRQMKKELSDFYPKSDTHGESISYWDIKNKYIATSSRLVPVDIVERSDKDQNQSVLDAIAFLSRPEEELKEHAKNSVFFAPEHSSGNYTGAVNIYRKFCGIIDEGMKADDIIALMVGGKKGLKKVFFGVVEDSTLLIKSPEACREMGLPATKLLNRTPDPRFNGVILRNVRWMRYGLTRELPRQKNNVVGWLCENAGSWYSMPKKNEENMEILSSTEFIDSTYPISLSI
ncbi:predicted protein [Chaetoceros tenuissimus]|uniref:Uncharacterized protein n=1 Tax=Chaetoceros tenuissimus TaxID=426638 RepID=A0AAD3DES1_9STRA|nr:predicted protein [Chaetoceros tenuissimus]